MVGGVVLDAKHCEVVALVDGLALQLAGVVVGDVMEEDVDHVVQGDGAGPRAEGALLLRQRHHGHGGQDGNSSKHHENQTCKTI